MKSWKLAAVAVLVPLLSAAVAALACWPIRGGPLATKALVFALILMAGVVAGVPACGALLARRTKQSPTPTTENGAPPWRFPRS